MDIALVGTGLLGTALAERFLQAGRTVASYDIRPQRREAMAELGCVVAERVQDAIVRAPVVVLSLPTSQVVAEVVSQVMASLAGKTIIDTTTGDPVDTARLGELLASQGVDYLDATIAGSSELVRQGEAVVMAGGPAHVMERCRPLLADFSRQAFHLGPWGSGARMKLVVNLALGLHRAVLAEALALARASGLELTAALEVLQAGPAYSRAMDAKGQKMIAGDFTPQARLSQHLKDVRLILEQAARGGVELPLSRLHETMLAGLEERGLGDLDNSAVFRAYD